MLELALPNPAYIESLFLAAVRVTAMFVVAPVFGSREIPAMSKVALGVLVAVVMVPPQGWATGLGPGLGYFLMALGREVLVGLLAGFGLSLAFSALHMASSLVGLQAGFGLGSAIDPTRGDSSGGLDRFYTLIVTLIFLTTNMHHLFLLGMSRLFQVVPVASFSFTALGLERFARLSATIFVESIKIALPITGALLLADVALAAMNRAAPQMNIYFAIGLPLKVALAMVGLIVTLPFLAIQIRDLLQGVISDVVVFLNAGAP